MKKWFILFFSLYIVVYVSNRLGFVYPRLIQSYFRDLVCVPVIAPLSVWFMQWYTKDTDYKLKVWQVVYIVVLVSVTFELIAPRFSEKYTADFLDVVMYILGACFYWKFMNQTAEKTNELLTSL